MKTVLVTGGAGYVGSHCCKAFAEAGWNVVAFDDLRRGSREAVKWGPLIQADISNADAIGAALNRHRPDLVAHFAGYASVEESISKPHVYYVNNSHSSSVLFQQMMASGVVNLIFSSSCATYGLPVRFPIDEDHPQAPISPYGWSKLIVERMLQDYYRAYGLNSTSLRYFNAAGCDPDGEIGEKNQYEMRAIPNAIMAGLRGAQFTVNGKDYDTVDGTAVRDYVHVSDLARAHVLAGEMLLREGGTRAFNLGTGIGTSVLQIVAAVERTLGHALPLRVGPRRPGDPSALVASAVKAHDELGWTPRLSQIEVIVETALHWITSHQTDLHAAGLRS
jgi:UDP-arabinose 4-epimerase